MVIIVISKLQTQTHFENIYFPGGGGENDSNNLKD